MSANPLQELREFHAFLGEKLGNGGADMSPEAALDEWRELHPDSEDFEDEDGEADSVAAIQAALDDLAKGDEGIPFEEFDREFRKQRNIPGPQ